jgi:Flp pilus assembly pilin Flp
MNLLNFLRTLLAGERGEGRTEYAILIGTLAIGAIVTLLAAGAKLHTVLAAPATRTALRLF